MKFAERLLAESNATWDGGYIDYTSLAQTVEECTTLKPGTVLRPDDVVGSFTDLLAAQLRGIDEFFGRKETALVGQWGQLQATRAQDAQLADVDRPILSVLRTHVHRTCKANPGECKAVSRLQSKEHYLAKFVILYDQAEQLRQLVALNHMGFSKIMKNFEKKSGFKIVRSFGPLLQAAKFYTSSGMPRLLTDMECVAKALFMKNEAEDPKVRDEFTCGVCLDVLRKPVVLSCAHRFCWHCAASSCVSAASCANWSCPLCRRVQPMTADMFTVSNQLESFIQEHVEPTGAKSPERGAERPKSFADIVQLKESWQQNQEGGEADPAASQQPRSAGVRGPAPGAKAAGSDKVKAAGSKQVAQAPAPAGAPPRETQTYTGRMVDLSGSGSSRLIAAFAVALPGSAVTEPEPLAKRKMLAQVKSEPATASAVEQPAKRRRGRPPADASLTAEQRKANRLVKNRIAAQRSYQVRKTPSWPRSWANFSLF